MRKLVWLLILAVAGFLVYTYYFKSATEEEQQVRALEKEFNRAVDRYITAMREVAEPGVVVIADPEFAANKVKEVRDKVTELIKTLKEQKSIQRARELETRIRDFCRKNEID